MRRQYKSQCFCKAEDEGRPEPALTISFPFLFPEPALTIPFAANKFPNKLAPKASNNILKNLPFCSFVSFLIVLVTPFSKKLESSRAWQFSLCRSFLHLKLLVLFFLNRVFSVEFPPQSLKQQLLFLIELKDFC